MAEYSKAQSTVIALWVLSRSMSGSKRPVPKGTAPAIITDVVNQLGDSHTSDSILLHTHGYERLLLDRRIEKTITCLQREIANELFAAGIVSKVYDA